MSGVANTGRLKGKTIFITGASRGIGLAIGKKAAKDGANIVIAAKTAVPHRHLPGTIFTAAKDIERAGGKALPLVVDIRDEGQVEKAVDEAVKTFGGIDILVNNASAISLTGTLDTTMKKYDLMNTVNARGTFMTSKICLPHLLKSPNAHILTLSPPLRMESKWFKSRTAYTMSKYGMSMCVLGMAEEFKGKVAVNALWPRTAVYTAAMEMLGGSDTNMARKCRKVDIMADAAYAILTRPISYSGNFVIDEDVVKEAGVTDLSEYTIDPFASLVTDFYVDEVAGQRSFISAVAGDTHQKSTGYATTYFASLHSKLSTDLVESIDSMFKIVIPEAGTWYVNLKTGSGEISQTTTETPDVTVTLTEKQFESVVTKKAHPAVLFMAGEIGIDGDFMRAMRLGKLFNH